MPGDSAKFDAFTAMYNELMLGDSGLSKLEREMIAVAVSSANHCYLLPHGAWRGGAPALRRSGSGRAAGDELSRRQAGRRASAPCSTSPVKLTKAPEAIDEPDRDTLRQAGLSDRDIWDIAATAAFFNMTNRMSAATDMRPNDEYHGQSR